ncbi:hypothetical protein GobsT_09840 [Gemmata obscuriglobus]|uniref:DUF1553 domain-containing protein n=1 Tax=Gemmata obscuriglobus TaxID=114 RepID=A0A2Z3H411_9BACT|nr:DUF1549 and DUF1553 domain-containing protein [Gemmata obscuriglobus]AWM40508.1 DUF1553 domain-containing protein [Gemmata obscuriglobus]QEG26245.1 hypothetical protein GobsT_09840 [Gemmata obscuriglobus]VTS01024.1 Uncharacterized protein OS=Singulisphaera acidiphila (strain ATCC BAA-1392 / DSM 18658 / VKM B-2454 / MOB10) GN=Sinac_5682 PE=4 SV=1: PSCyt2: PSD1 [Gemmata obscuriglobus UQM 2246]
MRYAYLLATLALALGGAARAQTIAVYPPDVNLETARDRQSFVVQLTQPDGITRDVTAQAQVTFANPALVKREGVFVLPVADGATDMVVAFGGQTVKVPVKVTRAKEDRPVSFKQDVMPVFMRAGCNSGGCHGAARGKDGFRLSLFGFDPDGDHFRLTREVNGRRVNLAVPAESTLLEKATGKVAHTGGGKIKEGDEYYQTITRWLEADAPTDAPTVALPVGLEVYPPSAVLDGRDEKQRLVVRAKYSDGTDRDVTALALFLSSNDSAAKIPPDGDGTATAGDRGEAFLMARFHTFTIGVPFITLPKDLKFAWTNPPEANYIDTLVHNKLKKLRIEPSGVCDDQTFVRRVYLDIVGGLPTPEEYARFMVSTVPNKRELLVDELLDRKEFSELWVLKWAELLQIRSSNEVSYKAMLLYYGWLQEKISRNVPTDVWVKELLGANGGTFKNAATNYYQLERDVLKVTENVAQVFMGMRIGCAQCHNHPFDRWTMDDYYGFASFFTQIGRKGTDDARELVIFNSGGGEVNHPVHKRPMPAKFLGGTAPADVAGKDRRVVLANWLASPENPYFAKNLSNIVWNHFFGQGIVNEVDDVRISNPASNQELLDALGKKFTEYKYDFKKLVRDICTSHTYQRATQPTKTNESDTRNFARGPIRRIRAETMLDVITQVTDTKNKFQGLPLGARAVQIADGGVSTYFLTTFGRPTRETVCACEVRLEPTLSQSLHLLNGGTVEPKIAQGNLVGRLLQEKKSHAQVVEQIYIRCLSRGPKPDELKNLLAVVDAAKDKKQALEDVFWAVMNSREFMFNH